jgi:hypothetical protein
VSFIQAFGAFAKLRKPTISFVMSVRLSVRPHGTTRLDWTNFHEIWCFNIFLNLSRKLKFGQNLIRVTSTLREDKSTLVIVCRRILLRNRNDSDKRCTGSRKKYFVSFLFRKSCRLWDYMETYYRTRQATDGNVLRCKRFACWIANATDTVSVYVTLIASPR